MMQENKGLKILVIGGTGLVGKAIVMQLIHDERVSEIHSFSRRNIYLSHPKLTQHLVDFEHIDTWSEQLTGDVLFSAMGTTRSDAGSKEAQRRVDYDYQFQCAQAAAGNGVARYVLVSSIGADPSSSFFYLKMKGELDRAVHELGFQSAHILRPATLTGLRETPRTMEKFFEPVTRLLSKLPFLKAQRPISGEQVANAAIFFAMQAKPGYHVHESLELFDPA
jgi:uncharacterized protein YbjT (DUF2867 family)